MIIKIFLSLQDPLITRSGSNLVNKTMIMKTLDIPEKNKIKIIINIKS
jgi:hypothetical protein